MSEWLRRNRWFLVALAVLIPVSFVVSLIPRFWPHLEAQPIVTHVPRGDIAQYAGVEIQLTDLDLLDGEQYRAPAGADIVVATLAISVFEPPEVGSCDLHIVAVIDGVERTWEQGLADSDYDVPAYLDEYCSLSEAGRYHLQMVFYVPRGAVTEPVIEFSAWSAAPNVLRFH